MHERRTASSALVAWPATHTRRKGSSAGQTGTRGAIAARLSVGAAGQGRGTHATRGSTHQGSALVLARIAALGGDAAIAPAFCGNDLHRSPRSRTDRSFDELKTRLKFYLFLSRVKDGWMEKLYLKKRSKRKSSLNQTSSGRDKISNVDFFICVKQNCEVLGDPVGDR